MKKDREKPVVPEGDWVKRVDQLFSGTLNEQMRAIAEAMTTRFDTVSRMLAEQSGALADHASALAETKASVYETRTRTDERISDAVREMSESLSAQMDRATAAVRKELAELKRDINERLVTFWTEFHKELGARSAETEALKRTPSRTVVLDAESAPTGAEAG